MHLIKKCENLVYFLHQCVIINLPVEPLGEEVVGSNTAVAARSLLVGSVSV